MQTNRSGLNSRGRVRLGASASAALLIVLAVIVSVPSGAASNKSVYTGAITGSHPTRGGTLVVAGSPKWVATSLDPEYGATNEIPLQIFDTLVQFLPNKTGPQPDLATSWTISPNGLTYSFKLRAGVRFSNGAPLTAQDVAYTLHRMTTKANGTGQFIFSNTFKSITVVNPLEVRFVLSLPETSFIDYLGNTAISIVPESVITHESETKWAADPIGTGPFKVQSYNAGVSLHLVRNPFYWQKGLPYLNGVTFDFVSDANLRILDVKSGQANLADSIPYSQIGSLKHASNVVMSVQPVNAVDSVYWNTSVAPFDNQQFRQALAYATPVQDLIKSVYYGFGVPANSVIPRMEYWDSKAPYYAYDLTKAKQLLAEASTATTTTTIGTGTTVPASKSITIDVVGGDPNSTLTGTILQSAWEQLGLTVTINQTQGSSIFGDMFGGGYQVAVPPSQFFCSDAPAPDDSGNLVYNYPSGTHGLASYFDDPTLTRWVSLAEVSNSNKQRARLFAQLQVRAQNELPMLPITYPPGTYLASPTVKNVAGLGCGLVNFATTYLAKK